MTKYEKQFPKGKQYTKTRINVKKLSKNNKFKFHCTDSLLSKREKREEGSFQKDTFQPLYSGFYEYPQNAGILSLNV